MILGDPIEISFVYDKFNRNLGKKIKTKRICYIYVVIVNEKENLPFIKRELTDLYWNAENEATKKLTECRSN